MTASNRDDSIPRLQDFAARKRAGSEAVSFPDRDWEYISVHPCADEKAVLAQIGYSPERCTSVDFYWRCGGDVSLVQVQGRGYSQRRTPGIYARYEGGDSYAFNIVVVLESGVVRTSDLLLAMGRCVDLGFSESGFPGVGQTKHLTYVGPLEGASA